MIQINTIIGFEDVADWYWCDKQGFIYSTYDGSMRKLNGWINRGYSHIELTLNDGKRKQYQIHRIIATGFIPNNDDTRNEVDHINHIRNDNRVENLRWVNRRENTCEDVVWMQSQRTKVIQRTKSMKFTNPNSCYAPKKVMLFKHDGVIIFPSATSCGKYLGVTTQAIGKAIKNGKPCKGYKIKYM